MYKLRYTLVSSFICFLSITGSIDSGNSITTTVTWTDTFRKITHCPQISVQNLSNYINQTIYMIRCTLTSDAMSSQYGINKVLRVTDNLTIHDLHTSYYNQLKLIPPFVGVSLLSYRFYNSNSTSSRNVPKPYDLLWSTENYHVRVRCKVTTTPFNM